MQSALCFLTTYLSLLPIFCLLRPAHTELISNQELVRFFYQHERDIGHVVTNVNYFSYMYPKLSPTQVLKENCQEALTLSEQLGVKKITQKGFFGRVGLEMDRTPTAIKEIVWNPGAFHRRLICRYYKKYDVVSISENWAIVTTPLTLTSTSPKPNR
ncbi:MAG: hypothetical protein U0103_10055 [Candidatus Obscuribacterales bacterium]